MMERKRRRAAYSARGVAVTLGAVLASGVSASALEVTFPKAQPEFALKVPDGWSISRSALGVEMVSPEKDSLVIATVFKKDEPEIEVWNKQALGKMQAFGVAFDKQVKVPPPPPAAAARVVKDFAKTPGQFTFSGPPSVAEPGSDPTAPNAANTVTSLTDPTDMVPIKTKFKVVRYAGTKLKGNPVDVEFGISELPDKRLFVVMQESGSADMRASAIINSVRGAKFAPSASRKSGGE